MTHVRILARAFIIGRHFLLSGGSVKRMGLALVAIVACVMVGGTVEGAIYTSWLQFQYDKGHSGTIINAQFGPGSDISNPDELVFVNDCDALASPAAWSEERQPVANPVRLEFAAWAVANCAAAQSALLIQYGSWNFANPGQSTSPWDHLQNSATLGLRNGESISASPAVYFIDNDATIDTTRIVSVSDQGLLNIHSLTFAGINPQVGAQLQYPDPNIPGAVEDIDASNSYDFISPVIYQNPFWGDGPDAGAAVDDYAYVAMELPAQGGNHDVAIRSYDLQVAGNPAGVPRYDSTLLQGRKLTMATPAIVTQAAKRLFLPGGGTDPIFENGWTVPDDPIQDPVAVRPPWAPPVVWPPGQPWQPQPAAAKAYMIVATTDMNGANPQIDAFSIDANNLVNGKYPHMWTLPLLKASNGALTAIDLLWVAQAGGGVSQEPVVIAVEDDGHALFVEDPFAVAPVKTVQWNIDPAVPAPNANYIRASPTKVDQLIVFPWENNNFQPGGPNNNQFMISWVDPANVVPAAAAVNTFPVDANVFRLPHNPARVTPSGVFDSNNGYYNGMNDLYIGVLCPTQQQLCQGAAAAPNAGVLKLLKIQITNNCAGGCGVYMPMFQGAADVNWEIWGTPAMVGDTDSQNNYLFIPQQRPCQAQQAGGCAQNPAAGMLTSYWG